jgi:glycosyltransferase involved in cell wall biosynthesis
MLPDLSVVVVIHNMPREAPRTLQSLSASYQLHLEAKDYEVIVVDNDSNPPFDRSVIETLPGNFHLIRIDSAPPSPAHAINRGLAAARGQVIGVMIDGARIATPGLLHFARHGARLHPHAIVVTLGWYLGSDYQALASLSGYDSKEEDRLLDSIQWPRDGYRLFEVSTLGESSLEGWFPNFNDSSETMSESNALFMKREAWNLLGGFDERFNLPGGGLLNLDTYRRALDLPDARLVILLGEATFHQIHGGIATNAPPDLFRKRMRSWMAQYYSIRGTPWSAVKVKHAPTYLGPLPRPALARFVRGVIDPVRRTPLQPLGPSFDLWSWPDPPAPLPSDLTLAALVELMRDEFRAGRYDAAAVIARIARSRARDEVEPLRLLKLLAPYYDDREWKHPAPRSARFHLAVGKAYLLIGDTEKAAAEFHSATKMEPDLVEACTALAGLKTGRQTP